VATALFAQRTDLHTAQRAGVLVLYPVLIHFHVVALHLKSCVVAVGRHCLDRIAIIVSGMGVLAVTALLARSMLVCWN
jgi:hypothetical protein